MGKGLGQWAEAEAARFLEARGYRILARNYRGRRYEADLVAAGGGHLVFAEVKARRHRGYGSPWEAVDPRKQRRLAAAALDFWVRHPQYHHLAVRFDVLAVEPAPQGGGWRIHWLQDAFSPQDLP